MRTRFSIAAVTSLLVALPFSACASDGSGRAGAEPTYVHRIATNMKVPWGVGFLPNGAALVTERTTGRIYRIKDGSKRRYVGTIRQTAANGEGGLLGLAISPTFSTDRLIYVYVSTSSDNRVLKMRYSGGSLGPRSVVISGIPGAPTHDGGRIAFGPDGYLYVSTGDARQNPNPSQDLASLGGKILRITTTGAPAPGNPFPDSPVWSYGHRNVQGLAWDHNGQLWASEFGQNDADELNRIVPGGNYGWPICEGNLVQGTTTQCAAAHTEFTAPTLTFAPDDASPSGLAYADGHLWMGTLQGRALVRMAVAADSASATESGEFFAGRWGRLRTVALAPSGRLWLTTSNRDGRGSPVSSDDRILLIAP